ncbi:unnamed protein product [Rotaria sp. Silwood1]|nr:unnamed protein product [Rotaria sp. Silwood1]CAF4797366.1 unnamed protein product [Rotaria sp. Silwood1]
MNLLNFHLEKQEFAAPGAYKPLPCKGRHCANCGKCRDWYYTGTLADWQWIQNVKNWDEGDWERWRNGKHYKRFQRRDGYTCTLGGGHIHRIGGGHIHRIGIHYDCFCDDNRRV